MTWKRWAALAAGCAVALVAVAYPFGRPVVEFVVNLFDTSDFPARWHSGNWSTKHAWLHIISDLFLRSLWFGAGRRRPAKIDPRAQAVILAVTVVLAVLAPLLARLLYMACSRQREYLADASAARFTRYPEGLASALEKIAVAAPSMKGAGRGTATSA